MAECQLQIPTTTGGDEKSITVGKLFQYSCRGDFPPEVSGPAADQWKVQAPEKEDQYSLRLLKLESLSAQEVVLTFTSYRVGAKHFDPLILVHGDKKIELPALNFEVRSVIEKTDEMVEPYGPMALALQWPLFMWLALFALVALLTSFVAVTLRRQHQRRRLLEDLKKHDSSAPPLAELHQSYRAWRRENIFFHGGEASNDDLARVLNQVDRSFRLYMTRAFKVPAFDWNLKLILKDLKKYHPEVHNETALQIKKLFLEMSIAQAAKNLKPRDVVQLAESVRILAENMQDLLLKSKEKA